MSRGYIAHWCELVQVYESLSTNGTNYLSDVMKKRMLQNAMDNVDDSKKICTVNQQTGKATTFEAYKALVHSADASDKKSGEKKDATCNASSCDLDAYNPVDYLHDRYDLNTDIDMIYANAADTREGMISSNHFHQMIPESHKMWISLPPKDHKLIFKQDKSLCLLSLTDSFGSAHRWAGGQGCGAFAQQRDKSRNNLCVNFMIHKDDALCTT